jgi:multidrug efflux system outer membrane protein
MAREHRKTHRAIRFSTLAVCAFLCSCGTNPGKWKSSVDVPASWNATKDARPLNAAELKKWWRRFDDPVLDTLIAQALASSPDIKTALARIKESRGERSVQLSELLPSISGSGSDRLERRDEKITNQVTRSQTSNLSLDMSWQIDLFGRQQQNLAAASSDVKQTIQNYYGAQVTLTADVATAYVTLRGAQARLAVLQSNVSTRDETTKITRWKQEAGISDTLELQQAVSTLEQARAAIPTVEQTIAETKNQLAVLCGQTPGTLDPFLNRSRPLPKVPARITTGIPAEALNNRPDVRAAVEGVLAAYHRKSAAERERLPTIDLSGSIGLEALRSGTIFSPEATARTLAGSLLAGISQPIFEGGRITANININDAQAQQAVHGYESTALTALSEVENALIAIRRTAERLEVLRRADAAASEASELATRQYQAGEVDLLTVLDVQRTQLSVEEERVNTEADQLTAHIQLYKSLGGGWQPL